MNKAPIFEQHFVDSLRADADTTNSIRQVANAAYSWVNPTAVSNPQLIAHSPEMAKLLDFDQAVINSKQFAHVFGGNDLYDGMRPFAMNYAGHQFGNWAGQLGDGRAINLGERVGRDQQRWMLQLKGAGPTPYSRTADGRAVLRSSIREFLCSEAMFHLGVPMTRALSLVVTGDQIKRDMFYDGNAQFEPGAIVCRVSPSFIRFGSFQIHAARQETELLQQLADFTIREHFPHLGPPSKEVYEQWFAEICQSTAALMVEWMRVGFVHGVMNTDNMSILGLTIDYGPYGWVDNFDEDWTPNTTDAHSLRYTFGNQPAVAQWNLLQLARAILPIVGDSIGLQSSITEFPSLYQDRYERMMASKLGLSEWNAESEPERVADLLTLLKEEEIDYTIFFRTLSSFDTESDAVSFSKNHDAWYRAPSDRNMATMVSWLERYANRLAETSWEGDQRARVMNATNPKYILRNYLAQTAIEQAHAGDYAMIHRLLDAVRNPYDEQPEMEEYAGKRPEWARNKPGSSMLSCSS